MAERPLRIVQVATPWFSLPPTGYGGIEWVCADLVDGLVERGHEVTVVGVGTNGTRGRFVATLPEPAGSRVGTVFPEVLHAARADAVIARLRPDVVHDHSTAGPLQARQRSAPTVVTAHGPVAGEIGAYYAELDRAAHLVAISDAQRRHAPQLHWAGRVHNGVRIARFPYRERKEDFVLYLGRFSEEKGVHHAIDAARAARRPIVLAGDCTSAEDREYFDAEVVPRMQPDVRWVGEAEFATKVDLMSRARCLLFPIGWEEPFGMVMIEAMACGTPVVALRHGSVPEVVVDGVTGHVRDEPSELAAAIESVGRLSPAACRARVRERFDVDSMAAGYEAVYRRVIAEAADSARYRASEHRRSRLARAGDGADG
jgi:glycosyltransferase involved in cell wall biosynthesis